MYSQRNTTRASLMLLILICSVHHLFAIYPSVQSYSRRESKAGTQTWDIIQHPNNWMYFANNSGLLEFDGNRWTIYPIGNYTNLRSLCYAEGEDKIYAGGHNEFGYYARDKAGVLSYHSLMDKINSKERDFSGIWNIHKVEDAVFFQGETEMFRYKGGQMKQFRFDDKIDCSTVVYDVLMKASTNAGIAALNGEIFLQLQGTEILDKKKVCAILPINKKDILFVTDFHGLYIFDGKKTIRYRTDIDDFMKENQVFCATIKDNKLAIGTVMGGLVVKDLIKNTNTFANIHSGLQNNTVLSVSFDRQNNLWLGLDNGVDYVMINSSIYDLFGNNKQYGSGYASIVRGNQLYLGTNQGLYSTPYPIKTSPKALNINLINNAQGQVWCLEEIDNILFCGNDHGLYIIDGLSAKQVAGVSGTWMLKELKSQPGYIIGSSYQGFFILKKTNKEWKLLNYVKGFADNGGMFEEDELGNIWFSHWLKGLSKLRLNEQMDRFVIEPFGTNKGFHINKGNSLFRIGNNIMFSNDGGFFKYNSSKNTLLHSPDLEKLFGILPYSVRIHESEYGDLWCVMANTVSVASKQKDGQFKLDTSSYSSLREKLIPGFENLNRVDDSTMIVSTIDGFSWIYLNKKGLNVPNIFKVSIRGVYLSNGKDIVVGEYQLKQNEIPKFSYNLNSIQFEFVASEFRNSNSVTYSYLLEHYDSDWSKYSSTNIKGYTKLPQGTYTFRVKAKNQIGKEVAETSYTFQVLPPWYESTVALFVYSFIFLFLIVRLTIFIKQKSEKGARDMQIRKEREMLEQEKLYLASNQEKEKEIIALKNQRLQYDLRHKSQELASSTMNLIRKNEMLLEINHNIEKISTDLSQRVESEAINKRLDKMKQDIKLNIERDDNWKKFEENFDIVYENYLKRLGENYPSLTVSDKKLCAYLKLGLSSKEIAPLLNMTFRSVEMSRYRLRKKIDLERDINLTDFLQNF